MNGRWAYLNLYYPMITRLIKRADNVAKVQHQVLREKIQLAADSRFGRDHGFSTIRDVADFRRQLPITNFEYFRPYVEDVCNGNSEALFGPRTNVRMFALTSGTTEKPKHIPITDDFVRSYKRGWKIWGLKTHWDHRDLLTKDYVHLVSDWQQSQTSGGLWCGNISGLAAETRPAIVRRPFIVPPQVGKIGDWTNRQYVALRLSMASPRVGMIITANPLTLVSLAHLADQKKESLLRDMRDGTLTLPDASGDDGNDLGPELSRRIRKVSRSRCQELESIVRTTGHLFPRDFWPQLSVVAVWMGGPVGAFVPEVRELYGDCAFRDHGLSASEGRMTIPMQDESNSGMLDFESNYYEFIPEGEYENEHPTLLEAHELEEGESYYILLTNSGGLYRYNIHDVVQCVGFVGKSPLLAFLHKGAHCTNIAGEKLTEYQVATAIRNGFGELNRNVETVMLVPVMGSPPRYVLLVEQSKSDYAERLAEKIDSHLSRLNCEYQDRIRTRRLQPIQTQEVPVGSWIGCVNERSPCGAVARNNINILFLARQTRSCRTWLPTSLDDADRSITTAVVLGTTINQSAAPYVGTTPSDHQSTEKGLPRIPTCARHWRIR